MELFPIDSPHVLSFVRQHEGNRIVVLANFSELPQEVDNNRLRTAGMGRFFEDLVQQRSITTNERFTLEPYEYLWLKRV